MSVLFTAHFATAQENSACHTCHSDKELAKENEAGKPVSLYVDEQLYNDTIHSEFYCVDCHTDLVGAEEFGADAAISRTSK